MSRRKEHYDYIGRYHIALSEHLKKHPNKPFEYEPFIVSILLLIFTKQPNTVHITPKDIYEKYVPMGFKNFKIEGRSLPYFSVLESYIYYLVKPEYKDEARLFMLLSKLEVVKS